jgi:MoaA/NifB/PqqE/SkfB family radical SAM enzyme
VLSGVLSLRPKALRFTGGEPLLLRELPELIQQASSAGVRVSVISNGRILAPKVPTLVDSGCQEVVLSIDALGPRHDRIRDTQGLFDRCLAAIDRMHEARLPYGVNTVLQAIGIDDLEPLGELLLSRAQRPEWWHLIPVRGEAELTPSEEQIERAEDVIARLREKCASTGIRLIARADAFRETGPQPCSVPSFTAYVRSDTGDMFGCNMLVYADPPIGNTVNWRAQDAWRSLNALNLRSRCAAGTNSSCGRCDRSSRAMNYFLRERATVDGAG